MAGYQHALVNLIIALQGIIILTSGAKRQQFYEAYSQFTLGQEEDQKLGEVILIVASVIMIAIAFTSNIIFRMLSIIVFSVYVCFAQNLAQHYSMADLAVFVAQMFILGFAVFANMNAFCDATFEPLKKEKRQTIQKIGSSNNEVYQKHQNKKVEQANKKVK